LLWHDSAVIVAAKIRFQLLADLLHPLTLSIRLRRSLQAEILFLRRQLALFTERSIKPRRIDTATQISVTLLSRCFEWRPALVAIRPETLMRWHRAG
jgi:putative transposase